MMSLTRSKFASRIAPAAESANKYVKASTVKLVGPNRLNLAKIMANQNTRMTKGKAIEPPLCAKRRRRSCERCFAVSAIWLFKDRYSGQRLIHHHDQRRPIILCPADIIRPETLVGGTEPGLAATGAGNPQIGEGARRSIPICRR